MTDSSPLFVAAVAAVVVRGDTLLALRRAAHKDAGAGLWETLSGRLEPNEDPFGAVGREIVEETGLRVEIDRRPLTAYTARRRAHPMIVIVYRARHLAGEVRLSDEHDAFAWLNPDEFAARSSLDKLVAAARLAFERPPGGC